MFTLIDEKKNLKNQTYLLISKISYTKYKKRR